MGLENKPENLKVKNAEEKITLPASPDRTLEQEAALLQRPEILRDRINKAQARIAELEVTGAKPESKELIYQRRILNDAEKELGYIETRIAHE